MRPPPPKFSPVRRRDRDLFYLDAQERREEAARQDRGYPRLKARVAAAAAGGPRLSEAERRAALFHKLVSYNPLETTIPHLDRLSGEVSEPRWERWRKPVFYGPAGVKLTWRLVGDELQIGVLRSFDRWANSVDFRAPARRGWRRALRAAAEAVASKDERAHSSHWGLGLEVVVRRRDVPLVLVSPGRRGDDGRAFHRKMRRK